MNKDSKDFALRGNVVPRRSQTVDTDATVKNKWRWNWKQNTKGKCFQIVLKKLRIPGKAYCTVCQCEICYAFGGKQALLDHLKGKSHMQKVKTVNDNFHLSGKLLFTQGNDCPITNGLCLVFDGSVWLIAQ